MRYKSIQYVLLAATLIVATTVLLTVTLPGEGRLNNALQNAGHFPLFALLTIVLLWSFKPTRARSFWLVLLGCLCFGMAVEGIQSFIGREASIRDVMLDALGITAGSLLYLRLFGGKVRSIPSITIIALMSLFALSEPLYWWLVSQARQAEFPRLLFLDHLLANATIQGNYGSEVKIIKRPTGSTDIEDLNDGHCALVRLGNGTWPGISLIDPEPNWSDYKSLEIVLYYALADPLTLTLRVNDRIHNNLHEDRYNQSMEVNQGYNRFHIPLDELKNAPLGRVMTMSEITDIILFANRADVGKEFCLISLRLI